MIYLVLLNWNVTIHTLSYVLCITLIHDDHFCLHKFGAKVLHYSQVNKDECFFIGRIYRQGFLKILTRCQAVNPTGKHKKRHSMLWLLCTIKRVALEPI